MTIQTSWISCSVRHSLSYWVLQICNVKVFERWVVTIQSPPPHRCHSPWRGGCGRCWRSRSGPSCRTGWSTSSHSSPRTPPPGTKVIKYGLSFELIENFQKLFKQMNCSGLLYITGGLGGHPTIPAGWLRLTRGNKKSLCRILSWISCEDNGSVADLSRWRTSVWSSMIEHPSGREVRLGFQRSD